MSANLLAAFGSHVPPNVPQAVPPGYLIADDPDAGQPTSRSLANRPWAKRGRAQYIGLPIVERVLTAAGQFTTPSYFNAAKGDPRPGGIDLSIRGGFTGTITLQRCFTADAVDSSGTAIAEVWLDVETYTAPIEKVIQHFNPSVKWRLGVKDTDAFSAGGADSEPGEGPCVVRLSQV